MEERSDEVSPPCEGHAEGPPRNPPRGHEHSKRAVDLDLQLPQVQVERDLLPPQAFPREYGASKLSLLGYAASSTTWYPSRARGRLFPCRRIVCGLGSDARHVTEAQFGGEGRSFTVTPHPVPSAVPKLRRYVGGVLGRRCFGFGEQTSGGGDDIMEEAVRAFGLMQ